MNEDKDIYSQIAALQDEVNRLSARDRPGNYNRLSPQSKKGDLAIWGDRKSTRLPIGENGQVLIVDPMETGGMRWADPSELAAAAPLIVPFNHVAGTFTVWSNMPADETFLLGSFNHVLQVDLSDYSECRLTVTRGTVAAANGALIRLKYKTTFSTTVGDYSTIGTSAVSVDVTNGSTVNTSSWIPLADGAKADVFLAVAGDDGDASADPDFGAIIASFR